MTALVAASALLLGGCGVASDRNLAPQLPRIADLGGRTREYTTLAELAQYASAVVIAVPTGKEFTKPLPAGYGPPDAAPNPYVQMRVTKVLSGALKSGVIDLVSPGIDENTGRQALAQGGPFLIFITPAMYDVNDPAGGYVAVGGPAGVYGTKGKGNAYARLDDESPRLPAEIIEGKTSIPRITKSEAQLLHEGPR